MRRSCLVFRCCLLAAASLLASRRSGWGEIFALPRSDKLLTFEVTVQGLDEKRNVERSGKHVEVFVPTKFRVTTREGTLFQIQDKGRSYWYGFVATFDEGSGALTVSQFGIDSPAPKVTNATGPFLPQKVQRDQVVEFMGSPGKRDLTLKYLGITKGSYPDAPPFRGDLSKLGTQQMEALRRIYGDPNETVCCVGCGQIRVCSDAVEIPRCGSCGSNGGFGQV